MNNYRRSLCLKVIKSQRRQLVSRIKELIRSEVASLICSNYIKTEKPPIQPVDVQDWSSPVFKDTFFKFLLSKEENVTLIRDKYVKHYSPDSDVDFFFF